MGICAGAGGHGHSGRDHPACARCKDGTPHSLHQDGTSLRVYNPGIRAWDVACGYAGKIFRLEARKEGDMIVLTNLDNEQRKWVLVSIEDDRFHWQNVTVQVDSTWHVKRT